MVSVKYLILSMLQDNSVIVDYYLSLNSGVKPVGLR